jgi:hypothetical protein
MEDSPKRSAFCALNTNDLLHDSIVPDRSEVKIQCPGGAWGTFREGRGLGKSVKVMETATNLARKRTKSQGFIYEDHFVPAGE